MDERTGTMDPSWDEGAANRGRLPSQGSGAVTGSGAGAGGDGTPESFDADDDAPNLTEGGR